MPRTLLTVIALLGACAVTAVLGEALDFNGVAYFGAMLLGMLLVSLTDRERFWGVGPGEPG
jgi:hypothetical protein